MTVSTTTNFELQRDTLIRRAFQLAGLIEASQTPRGDDLDLASDILGLELDSLQAEGVSLRHISRVKTDLVSGTASYAFAASVVDIVVSPDDKAGTVQTTGGATTYVKAISRQEYEVLQNKTTATGTPSLCYLEKGATITAYLYPVPNDSTLDFYCSQVRLPYDMDTGARTLDLARRWQKAIVYSMAWQLAMAKSVDLARVGFLQKTAETLKALARSDDSQKGDAQLWIRRY